MEIETGVRTTVGVVVLHPHINKAAAAAKILYFIFPFKDSFSTKLSMNVTDMSLSPSYYGEFLEEYRISRYIYKMQAVVNDIGHAPFLTEKI